MRTAGPPVEGLGADARRAVTLDDQGNRCEGSPVESDRDRIKADAERQQLARAFDPLVAGIVSASKRTDYL
jgi:hypothetical protein